MNQALIQKAKSGDTDAMLQLATLYMQNQDLDNAIGWIGEAALQGNVDAMADMADLYRHSRQMEKAFDWEEKATNGGRVLSMYNLSVCYRDGVGVPKSREMHQHWYDKAVKNGLANYRK